jgi:hypothetical protein
METTKTQFELTTQCVCEYYDEETGESVASDYCYGCWEDEKENFRYCVLAPWLDANGWDEYTRVRIEGYGMGWRGVSGFLNITADKILDGLSINSDYTLRFTLDGTELTCSRSSHDELGAFFRIVPVPEGEDEDY